MEVISQEEKKPFNIVNEFENCNKTPEKTKLPATENLNNVQGNLKQNQLYEEFTQITQNEIVDNTLKDMEETNNAMVVDEINDIDEKKFIENIRNDDETVNSKFKHKVNEDDSNPLENGQDMTETVDKDSYKAHNIKKSSRLKDPKVNKNKEVEVDIEDTNNKPTAVECEICSKTFNTKTGLNNHIRIHLRPEKEKMYRCSLCKEEFKKNMDLIDHKKTTHNNEEFLCNLCKLAFSDHCQYVLHGLNHTKKTKFYCAECNYSSNSKKLFKCHIPLHYDENLKCDVCAKTFRAHNLLYVHMQKHKTKLECGECGSIYNNKKMMDYHMLTHTGIRPYQCLYCGKGFFHPSGRKNHTLTHTKAVNLEFHCDKCDKKFRTKQILEKHKITHQGKNYECKICLKKLTHKESLRYHMFIHEKTNKNNKLLYPCMYCELQFPTFQILKIHTLYRHTDIRPYRCELCDKDFKTTKDLCRHENTKQHKNIAFAVKSKDP